ncbi:chemotaxis protein CheB [Hahella ganghwensis]|uniref:chemotaxis protein CheB n=1 Tax=Hahella ganghwensis TaxID=286420 RepID=UPI0003781D87|nr:chemotaxis protein CheB [Hahella ganghwensis]
MPGQQAVIGLVSDCPLQRHIMQAAIEGYGFTVAINSDPARIDKEYLERFASVQTWIVILADEDLWSDALDVMIESSEAPILFGLGEAPGKHSPDYAKWERRLYSKLVELVGEPETLSEHVETLNDLDTLVNRNPQAIPLPHHIRPATASDPVERVVILGASLGGPAAVKSFLDCLPVGLPVAYVYAQHIDQNSANVLVRVLGRHATVTLTEARQGGKLHNGEVVIMPVDQEVTFDEDGAMSFQEHAWPGPYGPSIDQVMLNVANFYGSKANAILFSGMGNDGAIAGPLLKAYGSRIWTQTSDSCANSSMPDSVADTGCVEFRGTPVQLADKLVKTIELEELSKRRRGIG